MILAGTADLMNLKIDVERGLDLHRARLNSETIILPATCKLVKGKIGCIRANLSLSQRSIDISTSSAGTWLIHRTL